MTSAERCFIDAQQRMLDRYGIDAAGCFVELPSLGGRAHLLVAGDGLPVVMINGIGTPAAMWAPLMAQMPGLQLIAVDLPGYGLTHAPKGFSLDLRSKAVQFLEELFDGLNLEQPALVANSLGSLWASWLALDRPNRLRALVHVGCPAALLDTSPPLPMRLLSMKVLGRLLTRLNPPSERQVEELAKMVHEHPLPRELSDLLLATERLPAFRLAFLSTLNTLVRLRGYRPNARLTPGQLTRITQPTLVFWGRSDPFGSIAAARRMVDTMPDAALQLLDGGHAPWLTQAEQIGPMTARFLS